jgi:metallophosphoesterase (TIGR00282 family)
VWDQKEVMELLGNEKRFLRPLNYPAGTPGRGSGVFEIKRWGGTPGEPNIKDGGRAQAPARGDARPTGLSIAVLNAQGRTFMQPPLDNPFLLAAEEAKRLRGQTRIIFVDFHAEATSEKIAFGRYLDGQVSAVVGTHTHVQTADEQILPHGTAYLTDAGFTGPHDGCLGREIEPVIRKFLTGMPQRFEVAKNRVLLHGAVIEIDDDSGKAIKIQRVSENLI